jgi:hypothetical protein
MKTTIEQHTINEDLIRMHAKYLKHIKEAVPQTLGAEYDAWSRAKEEMCAAIRAKTAELEEVCKDTAFQPYTNGESLRKAMDFDDRIVYNGPARVVQPVSQERIKHAEAMAAAISLDDSMLVDDGCGGLKAPEQAPRVCVCEREEEKERARVLGAPVAFYNGVVCRLLEH